VELGGFKFKDTHLSGDKLKNDMPSKALGICDMLSCLVIRLIFQTKAKGAQLVPDVNLEEDIDEATPKYVTKRMVWR
jgi:hypothetical protein